MGQRNLTYGSDSRGNYVEAGGRKAYYTKGDKRSAAAARGRVRRANRGRNRKRRRR